MHAKLPLRARVRVRVRVRVRAAPQVVRLWGLE